MDLGMWLAFAAASAVLVAIPGPTVLLVAGFALGEGRRSVPAAAAGVTLGDLIATSVSLAGMGAVLAASAMLYTSVKWAGAAYLVWLGIKLLRSAPSEGLTAKTAGREVTASGVFTHAAVVTALNPKSIAFFIAFVPQFLKPELPLGPQFVILIGTFVGLAAVNALAYALLADRLRESIGRPGIISGLTRMGGATLVGMGIATAVLRRPG